MAQYLKNRRVFALGQPLSLNVYEYLHQSTYDYGSVWHLPPDQQGVL